MRKKDKLKNIVYSTEHSEKSISCGNSIIVRVGRETKRRKGKGVTVITGILLNHNQLLKLAQQLKQKCGAGGTVKNGVIEIQGDHRNILLEELNGYGYKVKRE